MKRVMRGTLFLACVFLSSCSSSLHPPVAFHSASPVAPLLLVTPDHALINDKASQTYAQDVAAALADNGVLTTDNRANNQNWQLQISTTHQNGLIIPNYQILGPDKKSYAKMVGTPIFLQDWKTAQQARLSETAAKDSVSLSKMLAEINKTVQQNNPHSLANRTPVLFIGPTQGAPEQGDVTLPAALTQALKTAPLKLTSSKEDADFSVACSVKIIPTAPDQNLAEISWVIKDSGNRLVGQVTQLHELKASTSSRFWEAPPPSEIQEAAEGILTVIRNDNVKTKKNSAS